jgi:SAM-dependent methyltransferase
MSDIFGRVYNSGVWGRRESISGFGSNLVQTTAIRAALPKLIAELGVRTFLDIPCGDCYWMQHLDLGVESYIGADVVPELIARHNTILARPGREFRVLDVSRTELPKVDLIFCRDCLVHFSLEDGLMALANIRRSGSKFLVATTFPDRTPNFDIPTGHWRPINLCSAPFNLPPPLRLISEGCTEGDNEFADKSLGVWRISEL